MTTDKLLLPFLSDALGVMGFLFLFFRGLGSASKTILAAMEKMIGETFPPKIVAEMEEFLSDYLEVSDLQRRMTLLPLISIGSALTLGSNNNFPGIVVSLMAVWVLIYYVSLQLVPALSDVSKKGLFVSRRRLAALFILWTALSVVIKAFGIIH